MFKKYRKKPVVIEAFKFPRSEVIDYVRNNLPVSVEREIEVFRTPSSCWVHGRIETLEGTMEVSPDDYVICGIQGELYPCKPDIFESSYQAVED